MAKQTSPSAELRLRGRSGQGSAEQTASPVAELDQIIAEMHADGTLSELSMKWYGVDITKGPGA
jgi:ABC-type amino acid transport substrate-binding protein